MDWDKTVRELGPRLLRYFLCSFPPGTAEDLVQETLVRLVRLHRDGKFDPRKGSLVMYAFGIANHVRLESLKERSRDLRLVVGGAADEPSPEKNPAEQVGLELRRALLELKEVERQIVLLHIDEEMTLADIGAVLGMPLGTVKSHIHRAKETLRAVMRPGEGKEYESGT